MSESAREEPPTARAPLAPAWSVSLTTAGLGGYVGIAAAVSRAPGDRPAGMLLCGVIALALIALALARRRVDLLGRVLAAIGVGQALAALVMVLQHWGAPAVILAVNGILLAGWLVASALFFAVARSPGARSPNP